MSDPDKVPYRNQDRGQKRRSCIDCRAEAEATGRPMPRRKAPHAGPRCSTHARLKKAQRKDISRERRWELIYGLSAEDYWNIHSLQNGKCFICQRATGTGKRRLSVDHCHKSGMVRGLLCQKCNVDILGFARDDIEFFRRAIIYLERPPAVEAIGVRIVPNHIEE